MSLTLRDVAQAARVSISTASRALSGKGLANRKTEQRVKRIADELGYRPNTLARGLKTRSSRLVGLVLHNLMNASFGVVAEIVQKRLGEEGYQVILCVTGDDPEQESRTLVTLADHRIDGLIIVPTGKNGDQLARLDSSGLPIVCVVRRNEAVELEAVLAADPEGAHVGTSYLLDLGHRRIGLIVGREETTSGRERLSGYLRALRERGVGVEKDLVYSGAYHPETGVTASRKFLDMESPPTALFVANHEASLGVLRVLSERNVSIPDELSILCYEDLPWFRWHRPAISIIDNGAANIANLAVDRLMRRLGDESENSNHDERGEFRVGARLIIRESCRPISARKPDESARKAEIMDAG